MHGASLPSKPVCATASAAPQKEKLSGVTVLVVEDDPDMRLLTKMLLARAEASVATVRTAGEALAKLREFRPRVLVSDLNLPDQDGITLIQRIRALPVDLGGQTPALALSGHSDAAHRRAALAAGYQSYLTKPAPPWQLLDAVAALAGA
jgi:CheY-like chemotaxis protein